MIVGEFGLLPLPERAADATKVVTLDAANVALKELLFTEMFDCCARFRLFEVTQGVTTALVKPFKAKFIGVLELL